jgi:hypothetical protein
LTLAHSRLAGAQNQQEAPFKLNATQTDTLKDTGTSLSRQDLKKKKENVDPFSNEGPDDALDAPASAFAPEKPLIPPRPPVQQFPLEAQQGTMMPAQGRMAPGPTQDMAAVPDMPMARPPMPPPPAFNPNDPDASPDMMLAWDAWHKRVAATIFNRFNFFAKAAFQHSPPLAAHLSYQVTRDGHIVNITMDQKSNNVLFNVLVYQCIKSLEGDMSILAFPQGSHRTLVAKAGQFTQNYGQEGFRYVVGDQERVPGR